MTATVTRRSFDWWDGRKPRLLDLFCKAGGATKGYQQAGFYVVGVDIEPQPNYCGDEFIQADAMSFPLDGFDAYHGSPPCHDHSAMASLVGLDGTGWMLTATIDRLRTTGRPWIVENVATAKWPADAAVVQLCGQSFGLAVRRHRKFASNIPLVVPSCKHRRTDPPPIGVYGGGPSKEMRRRGRSFGVKASAEVSRAAMGIDWMTRSELAQAIPPAYTEHLGHQLLASIESAA